jgi:transcriptional regulator with XRE-family HTH domain
MSTDPLSRLLPAFGEVLVRRRTKQQLTIEALATATGLSGPAIASIERGVYSPTLLDVFRIASALGEEPAMLLVDIIEAWRADPRDSSHQSRPADCVRLFRLGYHHKPGDFRELVPMYHSVPEATHAAGILNAQRHTRGVALLDTVTVYVRLSYVALRPENGGGVQ